MNKLFLYFVGIGVLILFMIGGWELLQIATGQKSLVNQAVVEISRGRIFTEPMEKFLKQKQLERSGLANNVPTLEFVQ